MADILLAKPAEGVSQTVTCAPEARFIFEFPTTDAMLVRDGDNLTIQFADGSSLNLEGFYTEYNGENLPSFSIDGIEVAAADFFEAMNEPDLMPAAGPAAGPATGGRFHEYADASLADGLNHLDGLDWNTGDGLADAADTLGGGLGGAAGTLLADAALADAPLAGAGAGAGTGGTGTTPPENHDVTFSDPRQTSSGTTETDDSGRYTLKHTLREADLAKGSTPDTDDKKGQTEATGSLKVEAEDGIKTITVKLDNGEEITIPMDELLSDNGYSFSPHTEGTLTLWYDPVEGTIRYNYTLTDATQEHVGEYDSSMSHNFTITVTDVDNDSKDFDIQITIEDDKPDLQLNPPLGAGINGATGSYDGKEFLIGTLREHAGADGYADPEHPLTYTLTYTAADGKEVTVTGVVQDDGTIDFGALGFIKIAEGGNLFFTAGTASGAARHFKFGVSIRDTDDDTDSKFINFNIKGTEKSGYTGNAESDDTELGKQHDLGIELPDGVTPDPNTDIEVKDGQGNTIGNITVDENGKFIFTQSAAYRHEKGENSADVKQHIKFDVTLGDGTTAEFEADVTIDITDAEPTLTLEPAGDAGQFGAGEFLIGHMGANYGADGPADDAEGSITLKLTVIDSATGQKYEVEGSRTANGRKFTFVDPKTGVELGTATIDDEGNIFFTPAASAGGGKQCSLDVTITDSDHDSAHQSIDFNIDGTTYNNVGVDSFDADTIDGTPREYTINLDPGVTLQVKEADNVTYNEEEGTYTVQGEYGTFVIYENGRIIYTQTTAYKQHEKGFDEKGNEVIKDTPTDEITIQAKLPDGNTTEFTFTATINDSDPIAGDVTVFVDQADGISGNIFDDPGVSLGADSMPDPKVTWTVPEDWEQGIVGENFLQYTWKINGHTVTIELYHDGHYKLTGENLEDLEGIEFNFGYTITDADDSTASGKLTFTTDFDHDQHETGGEGNDVFTYTNDDFFIDGGDGIDFLLASEDISFSDLDNVRNVEVLLKGASGDELKGLDLEALSAKLEFDVSSDSNSITLKMAGEDEQFGWKQLDENTFVHFDNGKIDMTMETANLDVSSDVDNATLTLTLSQG